MDLIMNYWWLFLILFALVSGYYLFDRRKKIILVWRENQKVPAKLYGNAHFGKLGYKIIVCKNPNVELKKFGSKRALIYHFH